MASIFFDVLDKITFIIKPQSKSLYIEKSDTEVSIVAYTNFLFIKNIWQPIALICNIPYSVYSWIEPKY